MGSNDNFIDNNKHTSIDDQEVYLISPYSSVDSLDSSKTTIIQKPYLALFMYILLLMVYYISEKFSNDDSFFKKYEDMVYLLIILLTNFFLFKSLKKKQSSTVNLNIQALSSYKEYSSDEEDTTTGQSNGQTPNQGYNRDKTRSIGQKKRPQKNKGYRGQQPIQGCSLDEEDTTTSQSKGCRGQTPVRDTRSIGQGFSQKNLQLVVSAKSCTDNQCTQTRKGIDLTQTNQGVSTDQSQSFSNYHYSFLVLSLSTWGVHMLKKKYPNREKQLLMVINLLYSISFSILWMMFFPKSILLNYLIQQMEKLYEGEKKKMREIYQEDPEFFKQHPDIIKEFTDDHDDQKKKIQKFLLQFTEFGLYFFIYKFVIEKLDIKEDDPLKFLQSKFFAIIFPLFSLLNYLNINIVVFTMIFTLIHLIFVYDIKTKKTDPVVEKEDPVVEIEDPVVEIVEEESETNYIYMKWFVISIAVIILYQNMYKKKKN